MRGRKKNYHFDKIVTFAIGVALVFLGCSPHQELVKDPIIPWWQPCGKVERLPMQQVGVWDSGTMCDRAAQRTEDPSELVLHLLDVPDRDIGVSVDWMGERVCLALDAAPTAPPTDCRSAAKPERWLRITRGASRLQILCAVGPCSVGDVGFFSLPK